MSAFDTTLRVGEASVQGVESENGKIYEGHLILGVVTLIPIGPGQAAPLPIGVYRVPMNHDSVKGLHKQLGELLEVIEKPSDLVIGNDAEVEKAARIQQNILGA